MADYPIIMSGPMVRALLDGRKTQTRRLAWRRVYKGDFKPEDLIQRTENGIAHFKPTIWQKVKAGDRLWCRETYYLTDDGYNECAVYATDELEVARHINTVGNVAARLGLHKEWLRGHIKRRPSTHMPRWASRITLAVDWTRVERLQEITEADVIAEGLRADMPENIGVIGRPVAAPITWADGECYTAVDAFKRLWSSLHGPDSWQANPEVVAIGFTPRVCNIDEMGGNDG